MRRTALSLTAVLLLAVAGIGTTARPAGAQGVLDQIRKKAEAAKKAAQDSARAAAERAKTTMQGAAKGVTATGGGNAPEAQTAGVSQTPTKSSAHVEEQVMLAGDAGTTFTLSPHGQHVAAKVLKGSRTAMQYDGVVGPPFDEIAGIQAFSDDGSRFAYVARQGQQWVVMADGKEVARGAPYGQVSGNPTINSIGFTPGGKHFYFTLYDDTRGLYAHQLYFDGKPNPAVADPVQPVLSPDGEHYAYEFQVNRETGNPLPALMVDGTRAPYAGRSPQFTADGHLYTMMGVPRASAMDVLLDGKPIMRVGGIVLHFAPSGPAMLASVLAIGPRGERSQFLTIGNRRIPNTDCHGSGGINGVFFSADVKHWAIRCQDSNSAYWVMADGKKGQDYQAILSDVQLTDDGRPVYRARANNKEFLIVGTEEYGPYQAIVPQPDTGKNSNTSLNRAAVVAGNRVGFIAMEGNTSGVDRLVVVDGKAFKAQSATDLTFSPEGSHFAYVEGYPNPVVVLDGVQRIAAPLVHDTSDPLAMFVFSQDGKHIAFTSASPKEQKHGVAIDDGIFVTDAFGHHAVTFTPDGRHLVWLGIRSGASQRIYVDGEPALEYEQPAGGNAYQLAETWWGMGADGVLTFVGQAGGALKRWRITPGTTSVDSRKRGP